MLSPLSRRWGDCVPLGIASGEEHHNKEDAAYRLFPYRGLSGCAIVEKQPEFIHTNILEFTMSKKFNKSTDTKVALNVVRKNSDGLYQVYQIYAGMTIPLLGRQRRGQFVEHPARTIHEAFDRLYKEYYE